MSDFGNAFKSARASGKKVFTFNGKSYTTKLKSETATSQAGKAAPKLPKTGPTPSPRPSSVADSTGASVSPNSTANGPGRTKDDLIKSPTPGIAKPGSAIDKIYQKMQDKSVTAANAKQDAPTVSRANADSTAAGTAPTPQSPPVNSGRTKDDVIPKQGMLAKVAAAGSAIANADQKAQNAQVTAGNASQDDPPAQTYSRGNANQNTVRKVRQALRK